MNNPGHESFGAVAYLMGSIIVAIALILIFL